MPLRTPLYPQHIKAGAKIINFSGWEMPLHYGSQIKEHLQVRQHAGVFDVSHMTILDISDQGVTAYLRRLLANDVARASRNAKATYSCMLRDTGGIIDDLMVYALAENTYRLILNAATRNKDLSWLQEHASNQKVQIQERNDLGLLAIQGPEAISLTTQVLLASQANQITQIAPFYGTTLDNWFVARTGYTGEDGLEIMLPTQEMATFWDKLLAVGVTPCGLGARDTLRLEAGLMLYGQDLDEQHTPLESGLGWTVAWEPSQRDFIGREALQAQRQSGIKHKIVGLIMKEKGIMRSGQNVFFPQNETGIITSGSFSPTLGCSIALARIPSHVHGAGFIELRGKKQPVDLVKPRFVKNGQPKINEE